MFNFVTLKSHQRETETNDNQHHLYLPLQLLFNHKQVIPCSLLSYAKHLSYALQCICEMSQC